LLSGGSAPKLASIVEEEINEVSAADWDKMQQYEEKEEPHIPSSPLPQSSSYQHQHESPRHQYDSRQPCNPQDSPSQARSGREQLSSSVPILSGRRHRRFSVSTSADMQHIKSSPQARAEFETKNYQHPNHKPQNQNQPSPTPKQPSPQQLQQPDMPPHPPSRSRKYSLDSRAFMEQKQISQETSGPGAPRQVKGVFKSSTTTTRPPSEAAKLVKKTLSNSSFFVKRKNPFIFECFDEETGVRFQLEVCKISQLNITGIHLKRLVGDIWQYKNMCTTLVNRLSL
jgi:hypothetical protein